MMNLVKKIKNSVNWFNFKNRGGYLLPLVFFVFSCGIAVYYYIIPPVKFTNLSFYHAYNNNPDYTIGYDFFYRIYDGIVTTESIVISEANVFFTEKNLLELLYSNRNLLNNNYYKRILPISDNIGTNYNLGQNPIPTVNTPLMKIDPNYFDKDDSSKKFSITLSISTIGVGGYGVISTSGYSPSGLYPSSIDFNRYITSNGTDFEKKTFYEIDDAHDDIKFLDGSNTIDIAFFVVLYGITENYVPIYSDVVYLGFVNDLSY